MTEATKALAKEVADEVVSQVFTRLGIDINDADEIRHFQANMQWVFRFRRLSEKVGATIILTIVTALTGGVLTLVWDAITTAKGGK
ncbi:MAG: hypothetical protein HYU59_05820 [Magnetospirillum gryphiswaldense]|nr:hypothetical protein [Magnetospirillum gryphiswaldense]